MIPHQNRCTASGAKNPIPQNTMPNTPRPAAIHTSAVMPVMIEADAMTMAICTPADASS